jgi:hypothetical protein
MLRGLRESSESRRSSRFGWAGPRRASRLALVAAVVPLLAACGQGSEPASAPPPPGAAAPKVSAPTATVQQISADSQSCLDLVGQKRYADALEPCERAVREGASADVEQALADARAGLKSEAQAAAAKTAAGALQGQSAEDAAKQSTSDALRNLGGTKDQP